MFLDFYLIAPLIMTDLMFFIALFVQGSCTA